MRTEFSWEPVYVALYFDADPTWFFREWGLGEPWWAWPSAHYCDLLLDARRLVIAPPLKSRPLSAEQMGEVLDGLQLAIDRTEPPHPVIGSVWDLCLEGIQKCRWWIGAPTQEGPA